MDKKNQILTLVLILQLVIVAVLFWPSESVAGRAQLFEGLEAGQIMRVTIQDKEGQEITLARGADGWVLPEAGDYPVQESKIDPLLTKLANIRGDRIVAQAESSHKRLMVAPDKYEGLITFELADGTRHALYVGSALRYQVNHVRVEGDDVVYLAFGFSPLEIDAGVTHWIDAVYFSVPSAQIVALTLDNPNGQFRFTIEGEKWRMEGLGADKQLNANNVRSVANRVSSVRIQKPLGREEKPEYGLDDPSAEVVVQSRDEEGQESTHILRVGATQELDGEPMRVVKSAASPFYVLVPEYGIEDLITRTRQDFLQQEPTPTPTSQ
jgi:hypothetical protein